MQLGRIATYDWSNRRVLDRLLMYERRIENSLYKTMDEIERRQLLRGLKEAKICEAEPAQVIPIPKG